MKRLLQLACVTLIAVAVMAQLDGADQHHQTWSEAVESSSMTEEERNAIDVVHVVSMNHLDVGYTKPAHDVVSDYIQEFYPAACATAKAAHASSEETFIYTTHPWLLSFFLDCPTNEKIKCPSQENRDAVEAALKAGDIAFQAFPLNAEAELYDESLYTAALQMAKDLAKKYGVEAPRTMTQRDVPGLTRGAIPILVDQGVELISIGVNTASAPPVVPAFNTPFIWKEPDTGKEIFAMVHPSGYGGIAKKDVVTVPGLNQILALNFKGDNLGPQTIAEVTDARKQLQQEYPNAKIIASTFDAFLDEFKPLAKQFAVTSQEIGDTWIHGCASDPLKFASFRAAQRARTTCVLSGSCDPSTDAMKDFDRHLIKHGEHTWGISMGMYLNDTTNWSNKQFEAVRGGDNYKFAESEWHSQRSWLDDGITAVEQDRPAFAMTVRDELGQLKAKKPDLKFYTPLNLSQPLNATSGLTVTFDPATGAISSLVDRTNPFKAPYEWSGPNNPIGLFEYQTFSSEEYMKWVCGSYAYTSCWGDFNKIGMETADPPAQAKMWTAKSVEGFNYDFGGANIQIHLTMDDYSVKYFGAPAEVYIGYIFTDETDEIDITVQWFNKTATRMAESIWFVMNPVVPKPTELWSFDALGSYINPLDVMKNGSQRIHGFGSGVQYGNGDVAVDVVSLDAGLVSPGEPWALPGNFAKPDMTKGWAFNLENNVWNTNYIMWYPFAGTPADSSFRFKLTFAVVNE